MSGGATCGLPFPVVWQQTRLSEGGGREDEGKGGREGQGRQEALQTQLIHTHHTNSHTHVHTGKTFAQTPTLICLIIITMMSSRCRQTSEREREREAERERREAERRGRREETTCSLPPFVFLPLLFPVSLRSTCATFARPEGGRRAVLARDRASKEEREADTVHAKRESEKGCREERERET